LRGTANTHAEHTLIAQFSNTVRMVRAIGPKNCYDALCKSRVWPGRRDSPATCDSGFVDLEGATVSSDELGFGQQLRHFREAAGYSQEALAERAGLSPNAISALERGERKRPYPDTLRRLAEALGLDDAQRTRLASSVSRAPKTPRPAAPVLNELAVASELPSDPTPLIGREREIEVIKHLVTHSPGRLLTLTGVGGVGKTRLALQIAREVGVDFPDGVLWVELAPLTDPDQVMPAIAHAAGLKDRLVGNPADIVQAHLRERQVLLVLDNFEHLPDAATPMAGLLRACPKLALLVTSRAPLSVRGEQEYAVPPLELPAEGHDHGPSDISDTPSAQLFTWLARQRDPGFQLDESNAPTVAAICQRLEGLPLAMELAAPKLKLLGAAGLLARLERALPILTGGARDLPARHRTMEAAIGWSYELLRPQEQALFRRLAVFSGGWTLEAAEAVIDGLDDAAADPLEGMAALVDQSMIRQMPHEGPSPRFTMLETLREFGIRHMETSSELEHARRAHLQWCLQLAEAGEAGLAGQDQPGWLQALETELDNFGAALAWTENDETEAQLRLAGALWRFWWWRGHLSEGRRWLSQVLERSGSRSSEGRAKALMADGMLALAQSDFPKAAQSLEESIGIRRITGDTRGLAQALNILGLLASSQGDFDRAQSTFEEALAFNHDVNDQFGIANVTSNLGNIARDQGDFRRAEGLITEGLQIYRELGHKRGIANALHNLGRISRDLGQVARAMELFQEALVLERELGDRINIATTLHNMGRIARDEGDVGKASRLLLESLNIRREMGDTLGVIKIAEDVADLAVGIGMGMEAAQLLGASSTLREKIGAPVPPADRPTIERVESALRDDLAPAHAIMSGTTMNADQLARTAIAILTGMQINVANENRA
jgi:predicted ATPase/DNA-binding XRE family transcriptional regulator